MSTRVPLSDFANSLPQNTVTLTSERQDESFHVSIAAPAGYVWPDLEAENLDEASHVVLVTAAGAMGKSMAARALAHHLSAPLVDLSRVRVGSDTLTGLLTRVLGWTQAPAFVDGLRAGTTSLILDAIDEAQLASGREHFLAFIQNVADFVKDGPTRRQIVIFGRRDAVDTAYLALLDTDATASIIDIAPLDHQQASEFVDLQLDTKKLNGEAYTVHRNHPQPFGQLRDAVLLEIAHAVGAEGHELQSIWRIVDDFVGYPPVLAVVAERLLVENPAAEMGRSNLRLGKSTTKAQRAKLLKLVIDGILEREHNKVVELLREAIGIPAEKAATLYREEEQLLRVLTYISPSQVDIIPPVLLNATERERYDEHIALFLPDHPFMVNGTIANTAFADYLRAYLTTAPLRDVHGVNRNQLVAACHPPGPFYAYFVHALGQSNDSGTHAARSVAQVSEEYVDDLIKSHIAGASGEHFVVLQGVRDDLVLHLLEHHSNSTTRILSLSFQVIDRSGVVVLSAPLSRCAIVLREGLVLMPRAEEVQLGPAVFVVADEIEIRGKRVSAIGEVSQSAGSVVLSAHRVRHDADVSVRTHPEGSLWINWAEPWHQWQRYYVDLADLDTTTDPKLSMQIFIALRRILRAFHQGAGNRPSIYGEMLDNLVIGDNAVFSATLEGMKQLGIVVFDSGQYRLNLDTLSEYRVSWVSLNSPDFASALSALHSAVCQTEELTKIIRARPDGGNPFDL